MQLTISSSTVYIPLYRLDVGGGLLAGVAAYVKRVRPEVAVIGVEAEDAAAMTESLLAGKRVTLNDVGLFADGAAVKQALLASAPALANPGLNIEGG